MPTVNINITTRYLLTFNYVPQNLEDYKQTVMIKVSRISAHVASGEENSIVNKFLLLV